MGIWCNWNYLSPFASGTPGLRGFGVSSLKNMRLFYETWNVIEPNSPIAIGELAKVLTPKEELQRIFEESSNTGDYRADEVWADGKCRRWCRRLCRRLKCSPTQWKAEDYFNRLIETEQMNVLDSVLENVLETSVSLAWHFKVDARTICRG